MGREIIRQDIAAGVAAALAAWTGAPLIIEYDNRIVVDTTTQVAPFLCVRTKFIDASQRDLGNDPALRFIGHIELAAAAKVGSGTSEANKILDFFYPKLHKRTMNTVRTYMADTGPTTLHLGWNYYTMLIPFWSDQLT